MVISKAGNFLPKKTKFLVITETAIRNAIRLTFSVIVEVCGVVIIWFILCVEIIAADINRSQKCGQVIQETAVPCVFAVRIFDQPIIIFVVFGIVGVVKVLLGTFWNLAIFEPDIGICCVTPRALKSWLTHMRSKCRMNRHCLFICLIFTDNRFEYK